MRGSGKAFRNWLFEFLENEKPGNKLPSDIKLAESWDVSPRTIRRAMTEAKERGLLMRVPGKGTFVASETDTAFSPPRVEPEISSSERLYRILVDSISRGNLRRGDPLPQMKYICLQYRVSEKTVIQAYRQLIRKGLVEKVGKRFWIGGFSPLIQHPRRREAYVIVPTAEDLPKVFTTASIGQTYRRLERDLRVGGILLRCITSDTLDALIPQWVRKQAYPAGLYFWAVVGSEVQDILRRIGLLVHGGQTAKTEVVFDLTEAEGAERKGPHVHFFSRGNLSTAQARSVGEYVSTRANRPVVFLFDLEKAQHSFRSGLLRYFKMIYEITGHPSFNHSIHLALLSRTGQSISSQYVMDQMTQRQPALKYIEYLNRKYLAKTMDMLRSNLRVYKGFNELLENQEKGALWISTSDTLASNAVEQLSAAGVSVPEQISLLSLQDNPEILHLSISACSPDHELVGYLMAHAIMGDIPLHYSSHGFVSLDVPLIERTTTPLTS